MEITNSTKANSFYVIITGLFRYNSKTINENQLFNDYYVWKNRIFDGNYNTTFDYLNHCYYDSYLSNIFPEIRHDHSPIDKLNFAFLNHLTLKKCRELPELFKNLSLKIGDKTILFNIDFIDLYLFPNEIGMFSIKFNFSNPEFLNLSTISDFLNRIRSLSTEISFNENSTISLKSFAETQILNSIEQNRDWDIYNPQLKSFILIDLADEFSQPELDSILYDIGNVSVIGSSKGNSIFAPSESYYNEQIEKNKISVFKNWSALSLFDTFTRISLNFPDKFKSWELDFFHVYIHCLHIKFYLYSINTEISDVTNINKQTEKLRNNFIEFINDYHHTQISYKFLPDLIQNKLMYSLDIHAEINQMEIKIQRINQHFQEKREKTMNFVLVVITFISVFSVIYDISSWLVRNGFDEKEIFPTGSLLVGFLIFSLISIFYFFKRK